MAKVLINTDRCKSCGYCVNSCPKGALSIGEKTNSNGYKYVVLDEKKCIACGICYKVCPDYVFSIKEEEEV